MNKEAALRAAAMRSSGFHSSDSDSPSSASEAEPSGVSRRRGVVPGGGPLGAAGRGGATGASRAAAGSLSDGGKGEGRGQGGGWGGGGGGTNNNRSQSPVPKLKLNPVFAGANTNGAAALPPMVGPDEQCLPRHQTHQSISRFLSYLTSNDVASTIHQSLADGVSLHEGRASSGTGNRDGGGTCGGDSGGMGGGGDGGWV
jgi:hypothetical protein